MIKSISISKSVHAELLCADVTSRDNPYLVSWFVELAVGLTQDPFRISLLLNRTRMLEVLLGSTYKTAKPHIKFTRYTNIFYLCCDGNLPDFALVVANYNMQMPLVCYLVFDLVSKRGVLSVSQRILADPSHRVALQRIFERFLNPWIRDGEVIKEPVMAGINKGIPSKIYWDTSTIRHFGHYIMNDLSFATRLYRYFLNFAPSFILARIDNGFLDVNIERSLITQKSCDFSQLQCFRNRLELLKMVRSSGAAVISLFDATVTAELADALKYSLSLNSNALDTLKDDECLAELHSSASEYDLIIGVGLRGGTREALNLSQLLEKLQEELLARNLKICYVFDGLSESKNNLVSTTKDLSLDYEVSLALDISSTLLRYSAKCFSVVGLPLASQLRGLAFCDFFIAHQGSSSAKYSYLLSKPVLLHGPIPLKRPRSNISICPVGVDFIAGYRGGPAPPELLLPPECILIADKRLDQSSLTRQELFRMNYFIDSVKAIPWILSAVHSAQYDTYPFFDRD